MPSTPRSTILAIALSFSALGLAACSASSDDGKDNNVGGSGGGGADPGAGAPGSAGNPDSAGGEGGSGATATDGGGNPGGASAGGNPPASSGHPEDIVRACRTAVACQFGDIGITLDNCVTDLVSYRLQPVFTFSARRQQMDRALACATNAADCDAYVSCATLDVPSCASNASGCQDELAFTCAYAGAKPHVTDCEALGLTCAAGACVVAADAADCDLNTFVPRCDGTSLVSCTLRAGGGNGELVEPCATGGACVETPNGSGCLPADAEPCEPSAAVCDGTSVSKCIGGYRVTDDCAAVGLSCGKQSAVHVPECLASPMECMPHLPAQLTGDTCDGDDIVGCANGTNVTLHCSDFGLGPCTSTAAGTSTCG